MTFYARLEELLSSSGANEMCQTVELRRRPDTRADARLFFRSRPWLSGPEGRKLVAALAAEPMVAEASCKQSAISLRFTDAALMEAAAAMTQSGSAGPQAGGPLAGASYVVGFAGPNVSKALHIGHLRNIAIGHALAACLTAAGARVERQSLVGDIGRNICEAIAGYRRFHDGEDPLALGMRWDRFIGICYSDYLRAGAVFAKDSPGGDPISRETEVAGDEADALMGRWLQGDPEVRETWRQVRDAVMDGHRQTLERLQVWIDRLDTESGAMSDVERLMTDGVQRGVLTRRPDGTIVFSSGRPEYPTMVLVRSDGFPTEHARLFAVYRRLERERAGATYIDLAGSEWQPASTVHRQILEALRPAEPAPRLEHMFLFHGMVTLDAGEQKMSSSSGDALLVDDILDRLVGSPQVQSIAAGSGGALSVEAVAAMVAKSFFLSRPMPSTIEFSWEALLNPTQNPGIQFARAWAGLAAAEAGGLEPGALGDLERLMVCRAVDLHRNVAQAARQISVVGLTSFLSHLCEHVGAAPGLPPRLRGLTRFVLESALRSLGLIR